MNLAVLWEHEIRQAAKAVARAHALGMETEGKRDAAVFGDALIDALNSCAAALSGAEDDGNSLVLSSVPGMAFRRRSLAAQGNPTAAALEPGLFGGSP